jgi:hypothetical protein
MCPYRRNNLRGFAWLCPENDAKPFDGTLAQIRHSREKRESRALLTDSTSRLDARFRGHDGNVQSPGKADSRQNDIPAMMARPVDGGFPVQRDAIS